MKIVDDFLERLRGDDSSDIQFSLSPRRLVMVDRFVSVCLSEDTSGHKHDEKGLFTSGGEGESKKKKNKIPKKYTVDTPAVVGDIADYYDGEGGFSGTKATLRRGKIEAVMERGGVPHVAVRGRNGDRIWIEQEWVKPVERNS